jgi:parallel beta-helix repeat protein
MFGRSPRYVATRQFLALALIAFGSPLICHSATVDIRPGDDIPTVVTANPAGTKFIIYPGTYRLTQNIVPKTGDSFIGQTVCAPPTSSCPAIISGSAIIGPLATFDGTNYKVTNQTQQNPIAPQNGKEVICDLAWPGCIYPEDLYFDGVPQQHLSGSTLPVIGPGQWWFDYTNHIIYFHDNPSGHTVETSVTDNAFGGPANNVTIQYLKVKEFANMYPRGAIGVGQDANALIQGTNWTVQDCEILLNHSYGVRVGFGIQILNNYIHDNGQMGIGGGLGVVSAPKTESTNAGIVIQGNLINHNDYAHFNPDFGSGGIKIGATSGVTVRGNTIQHNEGSGVHFDNQTQNTLLDGNTITDNTDSDGVNQEMGTGTSTFRNNVVQRNGTRVNDTYSTDQIAVHATTGVNIYCNVIEVSKGTGVNGWNINAADRGDSKYPSFQYLVATGNSFLYNTVIWDAGAIGGVGLMQDDAANQPNFFADNQTPDFNNYHMPSLASNFLYDNNNTQKNARKTFTEYQAAGADIHGTADTNSTNGFPTVAITSPADQSSFLTSLTVNATASDKSGINRVELYIDWKLQATLAGPPYDFTLTGLTKLLTGTHTVTAMAYSNAGIRNCYAVTLNKL